MELGLGIAALDLFFRLATGATSLEIVFTGGEPLLRFSALKSLVRHAESYAREANISINFVLKTNGTKIDNEVINFLKKHRFKAVVSIDGTPHAHDAQRKGQAGNNTHRTVITAFKALLNSGVHSVASITVIPSTSGSLLDNVKYLHAVGAECIDLAPAYGTVRWSRSDVAQFITGLKDVARYMWKSRATGANLEVGPLFRNSEHVRQQLRDSWGCGAVSTNIAILPTGQITGCSSLAMLATKHQDLIIGDARLGINDEASGRLLALAQAGRADRQSCRQCSASVNCAGGCLAINYAGCGKPLIPPRFYCQSMAALPTAWKIAWGN